MSEMYFDFDAYMDERKSQEKPFVVKAFNKKYEIPSDIPFDVVLDMQRKEKDGKGVMQNDQVEELANMIFGKETFQEWLKSGIGMTGVMVLMERVIGMYMSKANNTMKTMAKEQQNATP